VLQGQAEADVIKLKAQAEAEALQLIKAALDGDQNLITYRYIDKLGPGVKVMLVPSDNPYLLPLPDLTENLGSSSIPTTTLETEILPSITPTEVISPTMEATPTPTATAAP
jgi:hypothetical protein